MHFVGFVLIDIRKMHGQTHIKMSLLYSQFYNGPYFSNLTG